MNNKIQELTDIIYNEGVAKGQAQADQILAQAREQAEKIISDASVTDKIVTDSVKGFTADQKAFNEFMLRIAQEWGKNQQIEIKAQDADALTRYFNANAKALLDKGVKITQVNGQPAEFSIQPADGSYKVNFGTDEFINWFKSMLRPQLVETLF